MRKSKVIFIAVMTIFLLGFATNSAILMAAVIVDNSDTGFSWEGTWGTGTGDPSWGIDYRHHETGTGTNTATWSADLTSDNYNVYAWWVASSNRATNAPYTINYDTGSETVRVCQEICNGRWVYLGNYGFDGVSSVVLSDDADEYVIADAVRFAAGSPDNPYPIVDTNYIKFGGSDWHGSATSGYNDDIAWHVTGTGANTATWTTNIPAADNYNVYARWTTHDNRATNAPYTINYEGGSETVRVCQEIAGDQWVYLGNYPFNAGAYSVVLSDDADEYVMADAVKFEPGAPDNPYPIVDTNYIRFQGSGWEGFTTGGYNDDQAQHLAGTGSNTATWTTNIPAAGNYNVYAWWTEYSNRATNAPYTINYEGGSETVRVCQEIAGSQWVYLGNYPFNVGAYSVVLSDDADEYVMADAVKFEPGGPPANPYPIVDTPDVRITGSGWHGSTTSGYNNDTLYHDAGTGANTATWTTDIPSAGNYNVYAWWTEYSNRATNAPYTINYEGGSDTVRVCQEISGSQWVYLGNYPFNVGTYTVVLSDDADERVFADAIRFVSGNPDNPYPVADTHYVRFEGSGWHGSTTGGYNDDWAYHDAGTGTNKATWTANISLAGDHDVWAWWTENTNRATNAPFTVYYEGGSETVYKNQKTDGGKWVKLGTYNFQVGTYKVELTDLADGRVVADVIWWDNIGDNEGGTGDGMRDGWELFYGLDPAVDDSTEDEDSDGLNNLGEFQNGTDPTEADADGDGLLDGGEISNGTDPFDPDTDGDGLSDGWEVDHGFNPLVDDSGLVTIWDNDSTDGFWATAANWSDNSVPESGDVVVFNATSTDDCVGNDIQDNLQHVLLDFGYGGSLTIKQNAIASGDTLTVTGDITLNDGNIICEGDPSAGDGEGITINAANVFLSSGGTIHANGQGFAANAGPGKGYSGSNSGGGGYGGRGGYGVTYVAGLTYGSVEQPTALGSGGGGGSAGSGGGALRLDVDNTLTINGTISANGTNGVGGYGGGSGGSVWLTCNTLAGNGLISADGGNSGNTNAGGGSGGRMSLEWTSGNRTFSGVIRAAGGSGYQDGRPGTIYVPAGLWNQLYNATYPVNGSVALAPGSYNITTLHVTNNATLSCQGDDGDDLIVDNPDGTPTGTWPTSSGVPGFYGADYNYHEAGSGTDKFTWTVLITTPGTYEVFARWTEDPSRAPDATYTIYHDGGSTPVSVDQRSNGGTWVSLGSYAFDGSGDYVELAENPNGYVIADAVMTVLPQPGIVIASDNVTVDAGAKISADGEGFLNNAGPGTSYSSSNSGGGGHGGRGGYGATYVGGLTYGSLIQPTALGSGGGGGRGGKGGGALKLDVDNTLTINGTVSANGTKGISAYGGGSGGSVWLACGTLAGNGLISADGGNSGSTLTGGGSGGRISLEWTSGNRTFSGVIRAAGGSGYQDGRPGTIYVPAGLWNQLYNATYPVNGSVALAPGSYNITTLHVTNNATLSCQGDDDGDPVNGSGVVINSDNITVDYGAKISADGEGFLYNAGPGRSYSSSNSGGGGYGGTGGNGATYVGGPTYGSLHEPTALGSGGGGGRAGTGGGAVKLNVTSTLTIDGTISANGTKGISAYGGGSGGSIWLICGTFAGDGFITADGGDSGNINTGGGGGGRIHITRTTWTYTGIVGASGGVGYNNGEDGTLYYDNPFLDWTGEANYESDGLDPEWGKATATTFTYRIKYTHIYDKAPSAGHPKLRILKDGSEISGSPYSMSEVDTGDTIYDDGKLYYCEHVFDTKGDYTYYFDAETPSCGPGMGEGTLENSGPAVVGFYVAQNLNKTPPDDWYETIQLALDDANPGDTIQLDIGLTHHEQIIIPGGVTLTGDTADPTGTTITMDSAPVVSFAAVSSGSALQGLTIRYTGENATRNVPGRHYYVEIGDGSSDITIDKCLIGRDGYVSGWSSSNSRFLATTTYNDAGIYVGQTSSNITITNCKIRYLTGPGIAVDDGSNNITIENNHIYRNILPWDVREAPYYEAAPGIGLNGTARATITSNEIYENNVGIGSYDLNGTDGTEGVVHIEGNVIHHNNRAGIGLNTQSSSYFKSAEIVGNDIYSNGSGKYMGGMRIRYAYDLKIRQNHIHDNMRMGMYLDRVYDFAIYNNKFYRNYWNVRLERVGISENDQSFFYKNIVDPEGSIRGMYVYLAANTVFSSNIIRNADRWGAYFNTQSGPIDFRHNKVCNNGRPGLRVNGALSGNMFKNLIVGNGKVLQSRGAGVRFEPTASGDLEIYNNTVAENARAGISFEGGLTTSTYSIFYNIFAFNTLAGYKYGDTAWYPHDRWDWVDKHENFFFWNYGSLAGIPDRRSRRKFINAQWGGTGGSGTDDITMYDAHYNYDAGAWDFSNDPDDPYTLDPMDTTGLLDLADVEDGGAYSWYNGRSATYTEPVPATTPAGDPYVEPPAEDPPEVSEVPEPFLG